MSGWMRLVFCNLMFSWFHNHLFHNPYVAVEKNSEWEILLQVKPLGLMLQLYAPLHLSTLSPLLLQLHELLYFDILKTSFLEMKCDWVLCSTSWHGSFFSKWMCFNNTYYYKASTELLPLLNIQKSYDVSVLIIAPAENWQTLLGGGEVVGECVLYVITYLQNLKRNAPWCPTLLMIKAFAVQVSL